LLIHLGFVLRPLLRTRFLFLTLTPACSCVYICKFQFRPIHPPLGDYQQSYCRPYNSQFDRLPYPQGTIISKFTKFSGDQGKSTREHIDQFLAQLGELVDTEAFRVVYFHYL
jgi:hypothetical protein